MFDSCEDATGVASPSSSGAIAFLQKAPQGVAIFLRAWQRVLPACVAGPHEWRMNRHALRKPCALFHASQRDLQAALDDRVDDDREKREGLFQARWRRRLRRTLRRVKSACCIFPP